MHINKLEECIRDLYESVSLYPKFVIYIKEDEELDPVKEMIEYKKLIEIKKV